MNSKESGELDPAQGDVKATASGNAKAEETAGQKDGVDLKAGVPDHKGSFAEAGTVTEAGVPETPAQQPPHPPETAGKDGAGETGKTPDAAEEENAGDGGNAEDGKDAEDEETAGEENAGDEEDAEEEKNTDDGKDAEGGENAEDGVMTLRDHLRDLRSCLFRSFLWLIAGFCICYPFHEELFALLFAPLTAVMPEGSKLVYLSPPEAFFTYMKITLVAGLFLASPMVFYHLWAFIAPGLYREEKMRILPAAFFSAFFFISGGLFCYFVVFEVAFKFFMSYNKGNIQAMPALDETLSFVLQFLLAFGVVFELPLFAFLLARIGLISADTLRRFRRYAILIMVIVAAVLTPPDAVSQLLMAGPLILLYEAGILIAAIFGKKSAAAGTDKAPDEDD